MKVCSVEYQDTVDDEAAYVRESDQHNAAFVFSFGKASQIMRQTVEGLLELLLYKVCVK